MFYSLVNFIFVSKKMNNINQCQTPSLFSLINVQTCPSQWLPVQFHSLSTQSEATYLRKSFPGTNVNFMFLLLKKKDANFQKNFNGCSLGAFLSSIQVSSVEELVCYVGCSHCCVFSRISAAYLSFNTKVKTPSTWNRTGDLIITFCTTILRPTNWVVGKYTYTCLLSETFARQVDFLWSIHVSSWVWRTDFLLGVL